MTIKLSNSMKALKYDNVPSAYLESKGKPMDFEQDENFPAYSMSPEDINNFLHGFDGGEMLPENLYLKEREKPFRSDYPTSAVNPDKYGALFVNSDPKSNLDTLTPYQKTELFDVTPKSLQALVPQAIYEHDLGHVYDPRLNPSNPRNLFGENLEMFGRNLKSGNSPRIASREAPAVAAEKRFWRSK